MRKRKPLDPESVERLMNVSRRMKRQCALAWRESKGLSTEQCMLSQAIYWRRQQVYYANLFVEVTAGQQVWSFAL